MTKHRDTLYSNFHTRAGVLMFPESYQSDRKMLAELLRVFNDHEALVLDVSFKRTWLTLRAAKHHRVSTPVKLPSTEVSEPLLGLVRHF